jgi:hypothetical protein
MLEFTSLKVSANGAADLATQLTSMSAQGWQVVSIVSTSEIVAYLSRPVSVTAKAPTPVQPTPVSDSVGWAATTNSPSNPNSFISPTPASSSTPSATSTQTPSAVPSVPADWYKDPAGRYEFRYWDGSQWTENVSRAGVMYKDPPTK